MYTRLLVFAAIAAVLVVYATTTPYHVVIAATEYPGSGGFIVSFNGTYFLVNTSYNVPIRFTEYRGVGGSVYYFTANNITATGKLSVSETCDGSLTITIPGVANATAECIMGSLLNIVVDVDPRYISDTLVATVLSLTGKVYPPFRIQSSAIVGTRITISVEPTGGARFVADAVNTSTMRVIWDTDLASQLFPPLEYVPAEKIVYDNGLLVFRSPYGKTAETVYRLVSAGVIVSVPEGHGGSVPSSCNSSEWCLLYSILPFTTSTPVMSPFGVVVFKEPGVIYYTKGRIEVYGEVEVSGKTYTTGIYGAGAVTPKTTTITVPEPSEPEAPESGMPLWFWFFAGVVVVVDALALLFQMKRRVIR